MNTYDWHTFDNVFLLGEDWWFKKVLGKLCYVSVHFHVHMYTYDWHTFESTYSCIDHSTVITIVHVNFVNLNNIDTRWKSYDVKRTRNIILRCDFYRAVISQDLNYFDSNGKSFFFPYFTPLFLV